MEDLLQEFKEDFKKWAINTHHTMNDSQNHYSEWKKPDKNKSA